MCVGIYLALIALFIFYSDFVISQFALSVESSNQQWMMIAIGWEMMVELWPAIVLAMIISSAVTLFVSRRFTKDKGCCE